MSNITNIKERCLMGIEIVFKIAGIGIILAVVNSILKHIGKEEIATFVTLTGVIIVLLMVLDLINNLFSTVRNLFMF